MGDFIYIGCDPGLSGCLVAINQDKEIVSYRDIEKIGDVIDVGLVVKWFKQFKPEDVIITCENPHIHAGDSIKTCYAAFCYGRSVATIQTIPQALGFEINLITPMTWKSYFNLVDAKITYEEKKKLSVVCAMLKSKSNIFMEEKQQGRVTRTIYHHDRAEAYLMAIYGLEKHLTN